MIKDILVPKTPDEIYNDLTSTDYVHFIKTLSDKMKLGEKESFFVPYISNDKFHPSLFNCKLFYDACRFSYPTLVKIMLEKPDFNPIGDNYYALRIAIHNGNKTIVRMLRESGLFNNINSCI